MDRPKHLPPTMRSRRRYIAYEVISSEKVNFDDISNAMWNSIVNFVGELGASQAGVWIVRNSYDETRQIGLIRCRHTHVEQIRSALSMTQRVGETRVLVRVLGISGTIKAAKKKFFGERDLTDFTS